MQTFNSFDALVAGQNATPLVSSMSVFNSTATLTENGYVRTDVKVTPDTFPKITPDMVKTMEQCSDAVTDVYKQFKDAVHQYGWDRFDEKEDPEAKRAIKILLETLQRAERSTGQA